MHEANDRRDEPELISVVIPAWNASATIDETLRSVRGQTHAALDIIVVDDGSTDATLAIAEGHAAADPRVRVVGQANGGVARARNTGWRAGRADLFCFVDADDLWTADKIERQLAALRAAPAGTGLVYSHYAIIDPTGRIVAEQEPVAWDGDVLDRLLLENFIGNGSAVLVTHRALEDARGFEPALRDAGAQGCEDILFYCRVAEHHRFAAAPGALIGYRESPGNMSSNLGRMLRSHHLAMAEMRGRHPDRDGRIRAGLRRYATWLIRRALYQRQIGALLDLLWISLRADRAEGCRLIAWETPRAIVDLLRQRRVARRRPTSSPAQARFFAIDVPCDGPR